MELKNIYGTVVFALESATTIAELVTADGVHRTCAVSQPFEDKNGKPGTPVPTVINREVQNAG